MTIFDFSSDDDLKIVDLTKPIPNNKPTGVGAGLSNAGNTCFIASVLQCLTHTVPLLDCLRSYNYHYPCNCGNENFCVLHTLRNHIEHALRSSGYDISINRFRDNLNYFSADFQINNQEDAHEFLQSFLDKLEKCCLDHSSSSRDSPGSVSSQDDNIVDHVFGGRLVSKLRCCSCNSTSETYETSSGWSLEIEDVEDLSSALESFTCVEKLEDQLTCDVCKEKVSKEKQLKFDKLPLVATFHLKRFKNDGVFMEKIFKDVKFPLELDLLPYMTSNEDLEASTKYHLYAMVEHLGNGIYFGHYSAYVRSAPETWHHFDDAKVWRISEECVLSKSAYMLFYAREGTPCFASAFQELKTLFEAVHTNLSPKSVLETTTTCSEECVSDHSYQNVSDSNNACNGSVRVSISGGNRTTIDEAYVHVLKIQEQVSSPKLKGPFQIQREHLQNKKKREETRITNPFRRSIGDPKEKKCAVSYLMSRPHSSRSRMIAAALGVNLKKKKVSNIRRSNLHRNLSQRQSNESS